MISENVLSTNKNIPVRISALKNDMKKINHIIIAIIVLFVMMPGVSIAGSQTFTSSAGFTVPSGVSSLTAVVVGGGGAGGGGTNEGAGGGGGGGGYSVATFAVTSGSYYYVTVGGGGSHSGAPHCEPNANAYSMGGAGGYSAIGPVIAYGGAGGGGASEGGAGGWGSTSSGSSGGWAPSRWATTGGAGGASGSGGAGGAAGSNSVEGTCSYSYNCNESYCECGAWTGGSPAVQAQPGSMWGGGGGGVGVNSTCDYWGGYAMYGGNGAQGVVVVSWADNPTASAGVSSNPVPYGSNPGFTLYSTNAYYCYLLLDWTTYLVAGYTTSGTYYAGAFTTPGSHTISAYCYNSAWAGSGWSTTNFTVSLPPPTINDVTISNGVVVTNGVNQYTITSTATEPTGGDFITDELALVNYQGTNAGTYRGYLGWSSVGFTHFGGAYKTPPIACSGGGLGAIYNGYGPEYINLISCSTGVSGNTRTVSYVVTFNTNFTSPINSNTISGYATNSITGLHSGWSPFSAFTITPTCSNGANNYPTCTTCSTPLGWNGSICTVCSNGGCTDGECSNGANNPVSCSTCTSPGFIWQSSTNSCIAVTPPVASITSPAINITIYEGQNQQFTGTATDADGTVVAYEWRLGGCYHGTLLSSLTSFVHSFVPGLYSVYFKAQDDMGAWSICKYRRVRVLVADPVNGACGGANGVPTQRKPSSNLCNTVGLPAPVVLPDSNLAPSWSWTCAGEYGGLDTSCGTVTSCGDGKCQPSKGESPATCRADCKVNVMEF